MDGIDSAVSLARALLTLERSERTGVLEVWGSGGRCRIAIVAGTPRAIAGDGELGDMLGDALLRSGDLDRAAHRRALAEGEPERPVGRWLVRHGVATGPAVKRALRRQLRARMIELFAWSGLEYRFEEGAADVGREWLPEPVPAADLVLSAMRRCLSAFAVEDVVRRFESGRLRLTSLGSALVADAALGPEEQAMVQPLQAGTTLAQLRRSSLGSRRALRTLGALGLLGALQHRSAPDERPRYATLLRKRRQVRGNASAHELLELPPGAHPAQARRALRRIAREVHPDTLGPDAPPALRSVSTEVMSALIRAEHDVSRRRSTVAG